MVQYGDVIERLKAHAGREVEIMMSGPGGLGQGVAAGVLGRSFADEDGVLICWRPENESLIMHCLELGRSEFREAFEGPDGWLTVVTSESPDQESMLNQRGEWLIEFRFGAAA